MCCYAFALAQDAYLVFLGPERSSHKMMWKVVLLGMACALGGATAHVSTADMCLFSLLRRVVRCGAGVLCRLGHQRHQECSADLGINVIVGVDDLPFMLSQVGRGECCVSEGAHHMEKMDEPTHTCSATGGPLNTVNSMCIPATTNADAVSDLYE